ncbi:phage holin family protein [Pantoea sp. LMR881]|uniref:phage holin family protein n=1 Tax=Pantoea sp. LMR881 TaxID=3014336 RepID=UPI0022AFB254|nr:phage holin family protein [Pantoea sp. LMR881]MCZ4058205.1 phage holin family protein [Pantoea sp. LMR881]
MPDKDPGFWASLVAWLYAHRNESGYAGLAGVMAILRATYLGKDSWSRRLLDAAMCSVFAFFFSRPFRSSAQYSTGTSVTTLRALLRCSLAFWVWITSHQRFAAR